MNSPPGLRSAFVWLALTSVLAAGCGVQGLSFVQDHRLDIVAPEDRAEVRLPLTVRWTIEDFEVTDPTTEGAQGDGSFAVFVDRAPQAPGKTVRSIADGDPTCEIDPACPSETYFASRGVYTTHDTQLTIEHIPGLAASDSRDIHEVSVVLLDRDGARIGESVWRVEFRVESGDES